MRVTQSHSRSSPLQCSRRFPVLGRQELLKVTKLTAFRCDPAEHLVASAGFKSFADRFRRPSGWSVRVVSASGSDTCMRPSLCPQGAICLSRAERDVSRQPPVRRRISCCCCRRRCDVGVGRRRRCNELECGGAKSTG